MRKHHNSDLADTFVHRINKELLDEFKTRQAKVRPAVEAMLEAAKAAASGAGAYSTYDDIFKSEE